MYHFFLTSSDSTIFLQSPFKYEEKDYICLLYSYKQTATLTVKNIS
jgi:hypothetical protein